MNLLTSSAAVLALLANGVHAAPPATKPATTRAAAKRPAPPAPAISATKAGLKYIVQPNGDRVPDFSYAGYAAGERPIPTVAAKLVVPALSGDATSAIQAAIDQVSRLPLDASHVRGAVLLPPGEFAVEGTLVITADGVVLRGSGSGEHGTVLRATGHARRNVVEIKGAASTVAAAFTGVADAYVPVNATSFRVDDPEALKKGDEIVVTRPSTPDWIASIHMDDLGGDRHGPSWRPGSRDVVWRRTVVNVADDRLTVDAPLTLALDAAFGGGRVSRIESSRRVRECGVENLRIVSDVDPANAKDEEHAWFGVSVNDADDVWVRRVAFEHLAGSAVAAWDQTRRVTVEDCQSRHPVSEIGGLRRNTFFISGQQVLMQRLYSEDGVHDFAVGFAAAGPNAFVQCESLHSFGESGPIDSAACGTLFDLVRVDGQALSLRNRTYQGQGVGWASFNGVLFNSTAPLIACEQPPGAQNWAFGTSGEFTGNGAFSGSNDDISPDSLYYAQLAERVGRAAGERASLNLPPVQGSRASTIESAAEAIAVSMKPRVDMPTWSRQLAERDALPASTDGVPVADAPQAPTTRPDRSHTLSVQNGWLVIDGKVAAGGQLECPWWNGGVRPTDLASAKPALTRFVPGRVGTGLTDDLSDVARGMTERGQVSVLQFPPLWYERRRDDHERMRRIDGDVVAPFYETPWARSGTGTASDGLSRWDVTQTDRWYFDRLRTFADLSAEHGFVLFNGLYQQHNILEAGAHYADAPWRPANNVNPVGIPEPVFFAGDKLIYVAEQFYDVTNADRRALHRTYIRNALNELADKPNVVFFLAAEYTGPLAFTQFWLDTVAEWKAETGKSPLIALYATKDVTDAVLSDPKRSAVVSMLYNSYDPGDAAWWYQPDGNPYTPEGGKNLTPRQWIRLLTPKQPGFAQVYQAVREYRTKYPDKPFVYRGPEQYAMAALLGGGSLPAVSIDPDLAVALVKMKPLTRAQGVVALGDGNGDDLLLCGEASGFAEIVHDQQATHTARRVDPATGRLSPWVESSEKRLAMLWLHRK